jgi:hypothetical protein
VAIAVNDEPLTDDGFAVTDVAPTQFASVEEVE